MKASVAQRLVSRMTPRTFKSIRHALGLSTERMARLLRISSARTLRRWERGDRDIPGPVTLLMELFQRRTISVEDCEKEDQP